MATEQLRLVDGTIVRKCPTIKPLYCSRAGKFYSVHNAILTDDGWVLREIKPVLKQAGPRKCTYTKGTGTHYPFMRHFQNKHCHFLVAAAWLGSRPEGMVIDHLNGNILDWSADNLEYVTPAENRRRVPYLRALREAIPMHAQTFTAEDYLRWFAMPLEDFKALLATLTPCDPHEIMLYERTHHMEGEKKQNHYAN